MAKLFADSVTRWRATAAERRLHGGKTVTQFLVGEVGSPASTWRRVNGYGPTPGERRTDAIRSYRLLTEQPTPTAGPAVPFLEY